MKDKFTLKKPIGQTIAQLHLEQSKLTDRQLQIVQLCASDLCDKQIADRIGISISTLNSHKHLIFEKLHVNSKSGLVNAAFHLKIIQ